MVAPGVLGGVTAGLFFVLVIFEGADVFAFLDFGVDLWVVFDDFAACEAAVVVADGCALTGASVAAKTIWDPIRIIPRLHIMKIRCIM